MAALELINTTLYSDANLVAYWRWENGSFTVDSKGSYTLTNNGPVGESTAIFGDCADFGTVNTTKYFSVSSQILNNGANATFFFWVKDTVIYWISSKAGVYENYIASGASYIAFHSHHTDGTDDDFGANATIDTGLHFIAITQKVSGSDLIKTVFYDGVNIGSKTVAGKTMNAWESPFYIGRVYYEGTSGLGKIDDFAIFTRVLSDTEISNHYNGLDGNSVHISNLAALGVG